MSHSKGGITSRVGEIKVFSRDMVWQYCWPKLWICGGNGMSEVGMWDKFTIRLGG